MPTPEQVLKGLERDVFNGEVLNHAHAVDAPDGKILTRVKIMLR
jgi:hypothetical protein